MEIHIGNRVTEVELVSKEDNKIILTIDGKTFEADVVMAENGTCNILMDGRSSNAQLIRKENGKSYKVNTHYSSFNVEIVDSQAKYLRMRKKGEEELSIDDLSSGTVLASIPAARQAEVDRSYNLTALALAGTSTILASIRSHLVTVSRV